MNRDELNKAHPELVAHLLAEGRASAPQAPTIDHAYLNAHHAALVGEIRAEGATGERERIAAVFSLGWDENGAARTSAKGFEKPVIAGMAEAGATRADIALRILDAREAKDKNAKAGHLEALKTDEVEGGKPAASQDLEASDVSPQLKRLRAADQIRKGTAAPSTN